MVLSKVIMFQVTNVDQENGRLHIKEAASSSRESPFDCNMCSKSFKKAHLLKQHLMVHTNQRPFTCEICAKPLHNLGVFLGTKIFTMNKKHLNVIHVLNLSPTDMISKNTK